jgi:hypothetical protein
MTIQKSSTPEISTADSAASHTPLLALGQVVATPGALRLLEKYGVNPFDLLARHASGNDWGDIDPEDRQANDHTY